HSMACRSYGLPESAGAGKALLSFAAVGEVDPDHAAEVARPVARSLVVRVPGVERLTHGGVERLPRSVTRHAEVSHDDRLVVPDLTIEPLDVVRGERLTRGQLGLEELERGLLPLVRRVFRISDPHRRPFDAYAEAVRDGRGQRERLLGAEIDGVGGPALVDGRPHPPRSEEHTSE